MSLDADVRHALMRTRRAPGLGLAVVLMLLALVSCPRDICAFCRTAAAPGGACTARRADRFDRGFALGLTAGHGWVAPAGDPKLGRPRACFARAGRRNRVTTGPTRTRWLGHKRLNARDFRLSLGFA
jgi:hypothetical protein